MLETKGLLLASDIEAKGFYDVVNSKDDIHCLCSINIVTDEVLLFHDNPKFDGERVTDPYDNKQYIIPPRKGTLEEGIQFWKEATNNGSKLIIHNAHTYDRPIIDKIWPDNGIPFDAYHDTFNQSKVQWFERPTPKGAKSAHGLKAYGIKCGINKPEITDWSTMDAFKLHRVIEDCRIQKSAYLALENERKYFKDNFGANFTVALKIEDAYANECFKQERRGAMVDVDHIRRCIVDLDEKIENLRLEIEPQLPPSLKGVGGRMSKSDVAILLGFNGSKVVDNKVLRKRNGEVVEEVEKPYYAPVVNLHVVKREVKYQGYHPEHEFSPVFERKSEFIEWRGNTHPKTKPKEWLVDKVENTYKELKTNVAEYFQCSPRDLDYVVGPFTKVSIQNSTMTQTEVVKSFLIKLGWRYAEEWNLQTDVYGNFIKVEERTEVLWPDGARREHQLSKVIPKGGYMVSSPILSEEDYKQLPEGLGKKIAEYNTYQHRRRFLENAKDPENKGLLSFVRDNGRIPCGVNNFGTRSGRGAQRVWVNAPAAKSLYGEEIRKCIIAPDGKMLVGVDMKSAQLSIAAYYANNEDYYNNVAVGLEFHPETDAYIGETAHCVNARMFGMVSEEQWKEAVRTQDKDLIHTLKLIRDASKGGSFAVIFGAMGKKVATTLGIPEKEGHSKREQFLRQMGLEAMIQRLGDFQNKYPYKSGFMLPLAFGYWLWNNSPHKSVNTVVQGFEALSQKLAVVRFAKEVARLGYENDIVKILDTHDEILIETTPELADLAGKLAGEAYSWAARQIYNFHVQNPDQFPNPEPPKLCIDLNGGYKVGKNYFEVH